MKGANRTSNAGFTMLELMVVVIIVGFLTLLAYPSYQGFLVKGNRAETQAYLMHLAQRQQQYFNDARVYAPTSEELDVAEPERVTDNYVVTFELSTVLPPGFTIAATPRNGTMQADDGVLSIDEAGTKLLKGNPW